jgi:DNA-binding transcriptional LysR family regulator
VGSAASRLLPERLRAFKTSYPGIEIVLLEGSDAEVSEWVRADAVEIGLTAEHSASLRGNVVAEDDFVAVVPRGHRLAKRRPIALGDLSNEPFIMSGSGCEPAIRSFFADSGCNLRVAFTVREMTTLFEMVRQGLGVTIVPSLSLPIDQTDIRMIELTPPRRRTLLALSKLNRTLPPAADAFVRLLTQNPFVSRDASA